MTCATPSNTRIFASDFQFGEFRAILRGVFVKKIHIFLRKEISVILRNYLTCDWKFFSRKILSERNYYKLVAAEALPPPVVNTATIADNIKNPTTFYNVDYKPSNTTYRNMWDAQQTGTDLS